MLTLKRLLSLAICAAIFISAIAACGEKIDDADRDTETAAAEVTAETTTVYRDENIPADLDLGGETINIWYFTQCSSSTESFIDMKGEHGSRRRRLLWNLSAEEQLNVKLNFYDCGFDAVMTEPKCASSSCPIQPITTYTT